MSDRVEWFTVTIPAGTLKSAPQVTKCVFQQGIVVEVDIIVPPGPSGVVGFFVGAGGSQYIPRTPGAFVVADNDYIVWPVQNAITSGSWQVTAYNTGLFPHTLQFGFQINEVGAANDSFGQPIGGSSSALTGALAGIPVTPPVAPDPLSPDFILSQIPATITAGG